MKQNGWTQTMASRVTTDHTARIFTKAVLIHCQMTARYCPSIMNQPAGTWHHSTPLALTPALDEPGDPYGRPHAG